MDKLNPNLLKKYEVVYELSIRGFLDVDDMNVSESIIILRKLLENKPFQSTFDKYDEEIGGVEIKELLKELMENIKRYPGKNSNENEDNTQDKQAEADLLNQCLKHEAKMEQIFKKLLKAMSSSFGRESITLNLLPSGSSLQSDDDQVEDGHEELNSPVATITSRSANFQSKFI
ncbi:hypothetical protein FQA39_LY17938 [Lamprigera yunnana]|nr:hypothetical protein FQA39_LY17938 [Lamprigera yunnana]